MNDFITPYSQTRGIVDNSISVAKTRLESNQKRMDSEKERIEQYRQERLASYYRMQSDLKQAERDRKRLEAMQNQNNGN